jgi:hypothetical protein
MFWNTSPSSTCSASFSLLTVFILVCQLILTSYFWRNLIYHNKYTCMSSYIYIYYVSIFFYFRQSGFQMDSFPQAPPPQNYMQHFFNSMCYMIQPILYFFYHTKKIVSSANHGAFHLSNSMIHPKRILYWSHEKIASNANHEAFHLSNSMIHPKLILYWSHEKIVSSANHEASHSSNSTLSLFPRPSQCQT